MKIALFATYIDLNKNPIYTEQTFALAEKIVAPDGKVSIVPIFSDETKSDYPALSFTGEKLTMQNVLAKLLLGENSDNKVVKAKLGYKILMAENEDVDFSEGDLEVIKKIVEEKEKSGLILIQTLNKLS